jgi:hypothetical protein
LNESNANEKNQQSMQPDRMKQISGSITQLNCHRLCPFLYHECCFPRVAIPFHCFGWA